MSAALYFDRSELCGDDPARAQVQADLLDLLPQGVSSVLDVGRPLAAPVCRARFDGPLTALPFEDRSFDLVLASEVLARLPVAELDQAVRELARVARRYVLVSVPNRAQYKALLTRCRRCGQTYHLDGQRRSWAETDLVHGLIPEPWRVAEVRYSGLFRPHDDPTVELRHKLELWNSCPDAACPACGAPAQHDTSDNERIDKYLDCLAANQWWADATPRFTFADRRDLIALYRYEPRAPRLYRPSTPTVARMPLLSLDFTNPLQRVLAWTLSPRWPCYLGVPEQIRCGEGVRLTHRDHLVNEIQIRFPVQPAAGDELILDLTSGARGVSTKLFAWDPVHETRLPLDCQCAAPGRQRLRFALGDSVRNCYADRYGFLTLLAFEGNASVRRAEYLPARAWSGAPVPWVYLAPGHQVFSQRTPQYVRSWGMIALEGGRLPLPEELLEPAPNRATHPENEEARLGKKRADSLVFQIGQEVSSEKLPLLESYHKVLSLGRQRVLVLSHMYPSRAQPGLGPFIHEQVSALRVNSGLDARVLCCVPFWFNTFHPVKIARAYRAYHKLFANLHWESHDGVPVLYLPYMVGGFFRHWLHYATYTSAILTASDWLRADFEFDIIHAHTSYLDGTAALALGRKFDVPYLLTEHTGPFHLLTDNPLMRRKTVAALTHARKVFCVSGALAGDVRSVLPQELHEKIEVLHNGVDTGLFYPPPAWTPNPAAPRFLSVISLDDNKNPLLLVDAFRRLLSDVPVARLDIVGAGPLKNVLLEKIRSENLGAAVSLLGFKTRSEVARLMREECDALVLPSNSETFGVVLIEALACGKPLVATDCGGPRDIVTNAAVGVLCPVRDVPALHEALRQVAGNLSHYRADTIRRHAVENYDYYNLASRLAEEYERLMG